MSEGNSSKVSELEEVEPVEREPIYAVEEEVTLDQREINSSRMVSPDIVGESIPRDAQLLPVLSPSSEAHLRNLSETLIAKFSELEFPESKESETPTPVPHPPRHAFSDTTKRVGGQREHYASKGAVVSTYQPPDGGWGWICVAVCFLDFVLIDGLARSYGAIYDDIRREYPTATHSEVAMAPSIFTTLYIGLGIVAGALSQRFSFRSVALVGGLLCGISVTLCYFASTLLFLTICFVFAGIGSAMVCTNSMLAVALYFRKKRALATGLSISGTSVGSMVQPPVVKYLTQLFGFRIALTCLGVVFLVAAPTALLLRDPTLERSRRPSVIQDVSPRYDPDNVILASVYLDREIPSHPAFSTEIISSEMTTQTSSPISKTPVSIISAPLSVNSSPTPPLSPSPVVSPSPTPPPVPPEPLITRSKSFPKKTKRIKPILRKKNGRGNNVKQVSSKSNLPDKDNKNIKFTEPGSSSSHKSLVPVNASSRESSIGTWSQDGSPTRSVSVKPSRTSSMSTGHFLLLQFRTHGEARYAVYEQMTRNKCLKWTKKHCYLDFAFMKNPVFLIVFISAMMIFCAYPGALIFLVPYVVSQGIDETIASLLISVSAGGDLISRLCSGVLLDKALFPKQYAFIAGMATLGVSTILILANNHIAYLIFLAAIYGLSTGLCVLSIPILLADHHGAHNLPSVFGIIRLGMAFMCLVSPPVSGSLRDATGSFVPSFVFMGGGTLVGTMIAMTLPYIKRKYRKRLETDINLVHQRGEHFYLQ